MFQTLTIVWFAFVAEECRSALWTADSPPHGAVLYACVGGDACLPWNFTLTAGQSVTGMKWYYEGLSSALVALFSRGKFESSPLFQQRVSYVGEGAITLHNVTRMDEGQFSVEIDVLDPNRGPLVLNRSVILKVGDDLMTEGGQLQVIQNPSGVLDPTSNAWAVELQCGRFLFEGDSPPLQVEWVTPSGAVAASKEYLDHYFRFTLFSPVVSGTYKCRLPQQYSEVACLHGNSSAHRREASLTVDGTEARLTILEAQQRALVAENKQLRKDNHHLNFHVAQAVQKLRDSMSSSAVYFHAARLATTSPGIGRPFVVSQVSVNMGNAYNADTGFFTAPLAGAYFFSGSSGSCGTANYVSAQLVRENQRVQFFKTYSSNKGVDMVSFSGVVHLNEGERVWIKALSSGSVYCRDVVTFNGFLIRPDPWYGH